MLNPSTTLHPLLVFCASALAVLLPVPGWAQVTPSAVTLVAGDPITPVQFSLAKGSSRTTWGAVFKLPPGLELSPAGLLSGTATGPGNYSQRIATANPSFGQNVTISILPNAPRITSPADRTHLGNAGLRLPSGPFRVSATGGTAPYKWTARISRIDPAPQAGGPNSTVAILPFDSTSADLSGNFSAAGNYTISVQAAGNNNFPQRSAAVFYTIQVGANPPRIVSPAPGTFLGNATVGVPFGPVEVGATGGFAPYSWTLTASGAPASQVQLAPRSGNATFLTANFTAPGNVTVNVVASGANRESSRPAAYTIRVLPLPKPAISPAGGFLANATAGVPYGPAALSALGGMPPYRWSANITSPAADGSSIAIAPSGGGNTSATLTGNFVKAATYGVRVTISDSNPAGSQSASANFQIPSSAPPPAPRVLPIRLPAAILGLPYPGFKFAASGGLAPLAWSCQPSPPAAGLSLSPAGILSGTPIEAPGASYPMAVPFKVSATDSVSRSGSADATLLVVRPLSVSGPSAISGPRYQPIAPAPFNAAGGLGNYTWSTTPRLPSSISIHPSTGLVSGNLSAAVGNYTVAITVADPASGQTASQNVTLTILPPGPFQWSTEPDLPGGKVRSAFTADLVVGGGTPPYTFAVKNGSALPPGLTLNSTTGRLFGTPTIPGAYSFTITARDSAIPSQTIERTFTQAIGAYGLAVGGPSNLAVQQYSTLAPAHYAATGGRPNYTYSTNPTLPAGLSLATTNATAGTATLGGIATAAPGNYTVAVTVRDGANQPASQNVTIAVTPPPPLVWTTESALPGGKVLTPYSTNLTASGGRPPYAYTTKNGSTLPAGLTLNATTGRLAGTPSTAGNHSFTITAKDSAVPAQTIERTFTLSVEPYGMALNGPSNLAVQQYAALAPALYTASGGRPNYSFSTAAALPVGLSLATTNATRGSATMSGNATAAPGNYTVAITVRDGANQPASQNVTITVTPPPPLVWATESALPGGKVLTPYSTNLTASGGRPPYAFTTKNGSTLPAGLTLNSTTGRLAGTPTLAGNHSFTITAKDSAAPANAIERTFTLSVEPYGMDLLLDCPIGGKVGQPLSVPFTVVGGQPPHTVSGGALPAGLSVSLANNRISGTPTTAGNFSVAWTLRDGRNQSVTKNCTITIAPADPLAIATPADLGSTSVNATFSAPFQATGGRPPYTWSFASRGNLPANANLTASGNFTAISPTPLAANFTIRVADSAGANATKAMVVQFVGPAFSQMVLVQGGTLPEGSFVANKTVASFLIGRTEVTWAEWKAVRAWAVANGYDLENIGQASGEDHPVGIGGATANWTSAVKWCNAKSEMEGLVPVYTINGEVYRAGDAFNSMELKTPDASPSANGYRLPREGEWEWAARGGLLSQNHTYSGGNDLDSVGWYLNNSVGNKTSPVGLKVANELGLFDMSGNAEEWCEDLGRGVTRTKKGGSHQGSAAFCRIVSRGPIPSHFTGFRLARNFGPKIHVQSNLLSAAVGRPIAGFTFGVRGALVSPAWSIAGGALPPGIGFNPATATLSGTPTQAGTFHFTVRVDEQGYRDELEFEVAVDSMPRFSEFVPVEGGTLPESAVLANTTVSYFEIGKYEVTWNLWQAVRDWAVQNGYPDLAGKGAGNFYSVEGAYPVNKVTWYDMVKWCNARSEKEGLLPVYSANGTVFRQGHFGSNGSDSVVVDESANGYRLPTQAEWEWAALGGVASKGFVYSGSDNVDEVGWYQENHGGFGSRPVGGKNPNELGIHDMSGNIAEFSEDLRILGGTWSIHEDLSAVSPKNIGETGRSAPDSAYFGLGFRLARNGGPNMVLVQGGTLPQGSELAGQTVPAFHIARFETTWAEWKEVRTWAAANGYDIGTAGQGSADNHPVRDINWYDAVKWCNAKSQMEGFAPVYTVGGSVYKTGQNIPAVEVASNGYRLPSESEWEWAARGGVDSQGYTYSGGDDLNAVAWHYYNSSGALVNLDNGRGTWPVGKKLPNKLGIFDMSGNVWEWFGGSVADSERRIRGGGWIGDADYCTVGNRGNYFSSDNRGGYVGFRYARNAIGDMVTVQGGTLPAGSELAGQKVQAFQIGRTEVTWDEWQTVRTWAVANGYTDLTGVGQGSAGSHPVRNVSWYDVVKWCNAKSQMEGMTPVYQSNGAVYKTGQSTPSENSAATGYRLPLEKEWEWSARGGDSSRGYTYSGSNDVDAVAWYDGNANSGISNTGTRPAGQKAANELGLFDMSGNGAEWCFGGYGGGNSRRAGGGSWVTPADGCAVFYRNENPVDTRLDWNGFRLARNIGPKVSITGDLPEAVLNQPYAGFTFGVAGTNRPVVWFIPEGALPPGMSFSATGTLGGIPTQIGLYTFVIRVESGGYSDEVEVELEVVASGQVDSDNDGVNDYREVYDGTNPSDNKSFDPLSIGLLAHYPFENSPSDESGFSKHLVDRFNAGYSTSFEGAGFALKTTSSTGAMTLKKSGIKGNQPRTFSAWIWSEGPQAWPQGYFLGLGYGGAPGGSFSTLALDYSKFPHPILFMDNNSPSIFSEQLPSFFGKWNHVIVTYENQASGAKMFINGVAVAVTLPDGNPNQLVNTVDGGITVSSFFDPNDIHGPQGRGFNGLVDNLRIYNRALGAAEVSQLYSIESGNRYTVILGNFTWEQAKSDAESRGGHLATVTSEAEWLQIKRELGASLDGKNLWLGASDSEQEGVWKWITGEAWEYSNWLPGQPDAHIPSEDFLHTIGYEDSQNRWNDLPSEPLKHPGATYEFYDGRRGNMNYLLERENLESNQWGMVPVGGGTLPAGSGLSGQSIAPFEIGKTEVTWDEWKSVRDWAVGNGYSDLAGVGEGSAGNHPVRSVNWFDAAKWCNAKSEKEGLDPVYSSGGGAYRTGQSAPSAVGTANGYRLPTEAEWEWAALGGPASRGFTYPGSNNLDEVAWHWGNSMGSANDYHEGRGTWPAGLKLPNELGIHDIAGNVEEWCWDFDFPGYRAYRGRSNATLPEFCPTLRRNTSPGQTPGSRNPHIGFRIARNGQNPSFSLAGTFQALAADGMSIRLFGKGFQHLKSIELLQSSRFYGIAPSAIHPDAIDFAVPPDSGAAFLGYSVLILEGDRGELAVAHPAFDYTAPQRISSPVDWTLGGSTLIIEEGGEVRIDGSGSGTFFVLSGGKLSGFGGGGSNRVWLEKGGEFQTAGGGGGGNEVAAVESISFALLQRLP